MAFDLVIGGGFAGLASAVDMAAAGRRVLLLERRSFLGGRAYSFTDRVTGDAVDNGQHLLMGCYHATLDFLAKIGTRNKLKFQATPRVDFLDECKGQVSLKCPLLPAPLHMLVGLARLDTIGWRDRFAALRVGFAIRHLNGDRKQLEQITVRDWLNKLGQPERLQRLFWGPITLATLNEAPERASADMFARVIEEAFLRSRKDSTIVMSRVGLSDLYTHDARHFIEAHGGEVRLNADVAQIQFNSTRAMGVTLRSGEQIEAKTITSAVPHNALARLLPTEVIANQECFVGFAQLKSSPIVSINLWFDESVTDIEFVGLIDSRIDWVFNKNTILGEKKRQQHLALVISNAHDVVRLPNKHLADIALTELQRFFPAAKRFRPFRALVLREHEATISHTIGTTYLRPSQRTPFENFFLAGDWTNTGLPATIEGAVRSGQECARTILTNHQTRSD